MRRLALLWPLCLLASPVVHAGGWSNLWLTPDQQGQHLLDAGHPDEAASRFEDPRRRAYADLKAGHYTAAADLLAPFHDARSLYNRGNAFARAGRLRAALNAYDAALKRAPDDRDAKHNRDLVARALRKQKHTGKQGNKRASGKRSGNRAQAKQQNATAQGGNNGHRRGRSANSGRGNSAGAAARQSSAARSAMPHAGKQRAGSADERDAASGAAAQAKESKQQAQRDAARAARLQAQRSSAGSGKHASTATFADAGTKPKPPKPETEQALSLDQWLRRIPDNPAGLLRRKFLIENALRRQSSR